VNKYKSLGNKARFAKKLAGEVENLARLAGRLEVYSQTAVDKRNMICVVFIDDDSEEFVIDRASEGVINAINTALEEAVNEFETWCANTKKGKL